MTKTPETPEVEIEAEAAEAIVRSNSKVAPKYKAKYADRERAMAKRPADLPRKVLARCNGDWFALTMARAVLDPKGKLMVPDLHAVFAANGLDPTRWAKLNPGQQRMSGGMALRHIVAENEELRLPSGEVAKPPRSWIAKHTS